MTTRYQPRRPAQGAFLDIRGLPLHVARWPGSDPRPTVMLHGLMDTGDTFQFLVDELSDRRNCLAADWRGFGRSGRAPAGYWFPDYYADLDALLDALGLDEPVVLIGHSMGGNIALAYAGLRPERVSAVVSIEGCGLPDTRPDLAPERLRQWLQQQREPPEPTVFPSAGVLAGVLMKRHPRLPEDRARFVAEAWSEPLADGSVRLRFDPAHKRVNPVLYRRAEAEACWRAIRAPVLYVVGNESRLFELVPGIGEPSMLAAIVPQLEACRLEHAAHMVHHDQPGPLAAAIESFLQRHVDGRHATGDPETS